MLGNSIDQFAMMGGDLRDTTIRSMDYCITELQSEIPSKEFQRGYAMFNKSENDSLRVPHKHSYTQDDDFSL